MGELIQDGAIGELSAAFVWGNRQLRQPGYLPAQGQPPTSLHYDLWIGPYGCDEREVLLQLLPQMHSGDLLILDRGYPGYEVIEALTERDIDFVIRMPKSTRWPRKASEADRFKAVVVFPTPPF